MMFEVVFVLPVVFVVGFPGYLLLRIPGRPSRHGALALAAVTGIATAWFQRYAFNRCTPGDRDFPCLIVDAWG